MLMLLRRGLVALRRRHREKVLVRTLLGLNDHLLADIGFRRDQIQPDGIHDLDAPSRPRAVPRRPMTRRVARPSLQGCG